ncbi:MAG: hypothetical protein ACI3U2_06650, partial [Anaerovibrio sp.]
SEAALKVFFGYMPHLSFFCLNRYKQSNPLDSILRCYSNQSILYDKPETGEWEAGETCHCLLMY